MTVPATFSWGGLLSCWQSQLLCLKGVPSHADSPSYCIWRGTRFTLTVPATLSWGVPSHSDSPSYILRMGSPLMLTVPFTVFQGGPLSCWGSQLLIFILFFLPFFWGGGGWGVSPLSCWPSLLLCLKGVPSSHADSLGYCVWSGSHLMLTVPATVFNRGPLSCWQSQLLSLKGVPSHADSPSYCIWSVCPWTLMLGKGRSTSSVLSNDFTSSDTLGKWVGRLGRRGA